MKVTVCFDNVKVRVPCGDGELTISELIKRAVNRYCKASFIENVQDIKVHCLQTTEQAILDIDDLVSDVCDDNDQLIAVYDDRNKKTLVLDNDTSDIDNNNIRNTHSTPYTSHTIHQDEEISPYITATLSDNDSGVAADSYGISSNPTSTHTSFKSSSRPPRGIQRKFPQNKNASFRSSASSNSPTSSPELSRKKLKGPAFSRDLNRKSLSTNHPMLYSWIDQHDRFNSPKFFQKDYSYEEEEEDEEGLSQHSSENEVVQLDRRASKTIDVQPYTMTSGKEVGLVVHNVEEGSYVDRVGELQTADRITEINGVDITPLTNVEAMDMYNAALKDEVIKLKRARSHSFLKDSLHLQTSTKNIISHDVPDQVIKASKEAPRPVPKLTNNEKPREAAIEAPSTTTVSSSKDAKRHVFTIDLLKEKDGLGFTVTSKDVLTNKDITFFIKNILGKGAAIKDGRLKAGDQLLAINDTEINNQSQAEVVKILRSAQGIVTLKLSRCKSEMTEEEITSLRDESTATLPRHAKSKSEVTPSSSVSPPSTEDILTLTILLTSSGADGLGISVKGKRSGDKHADDGIFVKSVINGGAAAKDGRLLPDDHLMCINDTSLIGLSNQDAMKVLRGSLEQSQQKGTIRIIIGRQNRNLFSRLSTGTSSPLPPASPVRGDQATSSFSRTSPNVNRKNFQRPESPSMDRGRKTPERSSPRLEMRRKISRERKSSNERKVSVERKPSIEGKEPKEQRESTKVTNLDEEFEEKYLQRGLTANHFAINRNKSYFRAMNVQPENDETQDSIDSRRTVSISSTEIPTIQRSVPVFIEQEGEIRNSKRGKMPLPSYEEALKRRNSNSSSSSKADSRNNSFKVLPDKYFAISKEPNPPAERTFSMDSNLPEKYILPKGQEIQRQFSKRKSLSLDSIKSPDGDLSESEIFRCNTLASQSSLDSILASSYQFSRDGFGRLSISEKKGRGQVDAKKSDFYNKLKKFKSMEELRPSSSTDEINFGDDAHTKLKKTESVDTLISRIDAEEQIQAFRRNEIHSATAPWGMSSPMANGGVTHKRNEKLPQEKHPVVRRRIKHPKNRRPYSCILADARHRNSLLNDSFKTALENLDSRSLSPTSSSAEEKKKKSGILKGITGLLKKNKKGKEGKIPTSPEQIESPPRNSQERLNEIVRRGNPPSRPHSMADTYHKKGFGLQADQLQKELVQAKIEEMKRTKRDVKKRKSDNEINRIGRVPEYGQSPAKGELKSGYNTWNVRDASLMREKSKQFFIDNTSAMNHEQEKNRNNINLQRQSSLPPRTKKESVEIHRVLPRAPSGPMYKSPEQKQRTPKTTDTTVPNHSRSSSTPSSKTATPVKQSVVKQTHSGRTPNRLKKPEDSEIRYSSISDLTRSGGSIKISHKAEI